MSRRAQPRMNSNHGQPAIVVDKKLTAVADWLRIEKKSGLRTKEAVQYEKRVEYFKGSKLVDVLLGPKYKGKLAKDMPVKTRIEAAKLAQELLRVGYIHRSQRVQHAHTRRWELELLPGPFAEDGLFTWVYEGSKTKLCRCGHLDACAFQQAQGEVSLTAATYFSRRYLMCGGLLAGALGLCMIQIWPLWMKIAVWWCSVTFLTTFGILCVLRLGLYMCMWVVGFRGVWLFPNLFDDNQTFAGSFMPVFGKGDPIEIEEDSDEEYWAHMRKKQAKKDKGEGETPDKAKSDSKPKSDPKERARQEEKAFQFGWINVILIFGLGALLCVKLGFFEGDNVPDFVAKRDDLEYYFPKLGAPEMDPKGNETHHANGKKKLKSVRDREKAEREADPFAQKGDEKIKF